MPSTRPFAAYIDSHQDELIAKLAEMVAIPSVSGDIAYRPEVHRMAKWLEAHLISLGVR